MKHTFLRLIYYVTQDVCQRKNSSTQTGDQPLAKKPEDSGYKMSVFIVAMLKGLITTLVSVMDISVMHVFR